MFTNLSIKNFRIFGQDETEIRLRPITILTGCNNSGKSSVTKALCLIKDFCRQVDDDYNNGRNLKLERYKFDFHKAPHSIMGSFDSVRHREPKSDKKHNETPVSEANNRIVFEFVVESSWILQYVILHLEFDSIASDDLNNGYLRAFSIRTLDDQVIYNAALGRFSKEPFMNFNLVKKHFLYFLYGQHLFAKVQDAIEYNEITGGSYPDTQQRFERFDTLMPELLNNLGAQEYVFLNEWQMLHADGYGHHAPSILKNVLDPSIPLISPRLGVYFCFPCFQEFIDVEKKSVRDKINSIIAAEAEPVSTLDQKIINLFLTGFESSDKQTLHEYVSMMEDEEFFKRPPFNFSDTEFGYPNCIPKLTHIIDEESDLPDNADWTVTAMAMDRINQMVTQSKESFLQYDEFNGAIIHKGQHVLANYFRKFVEDIFANIMPGEFQHSPTTGILPRRMFPLESNDDFSTTLNKYFEAQKAFRLAFDNMFSHKGEYKPCTFINKWVKELGIAQRVEIKTHAENSGVTIHLYDKNDRKGMMLADKGLGGMQIFTILLKIETAIIESKARKKLHPSCDAGIDSRFLAYLKTYSQRNPYTIALEEPECHLHPSLQSKLADMLVDAYKNYDIHFIIESHSEYLIRRLQLLVSKKKIYNDSISLCYINSPKSSSDDSVITDIGINEDGTLQNDFGEGFFDESIRMNKELYRINRQK